MTDSKADGVYGSRCLKLQERLAGSEMNGVLIVPGPNLRYYTNGNSLLLERPFLFLFPGTGEPHLVAPALEAGPYLRGPVRIKVHQWTDNEGPNKAIQGASSQIPVEGSWGCEGGVPFRFIFLLQKHANVKLTDAEAIFQDIRAVKDQQEVRAIKRAARILAKSFLKIPSILKAGMTELECAKKLTQVIYDYGADSVDDVLVQSGATAADPHHLASTRKLRRNETIVIDVGCRYRGYYADITRTFMIGKDQEFESIYENVLEAEQAAIRRSQPGMTVGSVDDAARSHLERKGFGRYFVHRTGHGLGLEVHEAPYIIGNGTEILQPFMVHTVEPGVYIPGRMGVRIEDEVLVTKSGRDVLTRVLPNEFEWWI